VSTAKHDDMRKIIGILKEKYQSKYKQVGLWLMTYGMPNVGKSSLLNQIRNISDLENKRTASKVTASVCTTKGTKGFKILQNPLMYLMDSPGVSIPSNIPNEIGLKLALTGIIKERVVDKMILLEFMMELFEK
jgi:ribosome biogenesis GTPase A